MRGWTIGVLAAGLLGFGAARAAPVSGTPFTLVEGTEVPRTPPLRDLVWQVYGYTRDSSRILASGPVHDGVAVLDDKGDHKLTLACEATERSGVAEVAAARDGWGYAARTEDGHICTWDAAGLLTRASSPKAATALALGGAETLVLGFEDGGLEARNPRNGRRRWARNPDLGPVVHLRFETDGPRVVASSRTMGVAVVDTRNGRLVRGLRGKPAWSSVFSPDGKKLAVGRAGGRVEVWDTAQWTLRDTLPFDDGRVIDVDWSPDGTQVAAALEEGSGATRAVTLEVYDLHLRTLVFRETAPNGPGPTRLRYDRSGERLVAGNGPGASRMWARPGARQVPRPLPNDEPPHQRPFDLPPVLPPLSPVAPVATATHPVATADGSGWLTLESGALSFVTGDTSIVLTDSDGAAAPFAIAADGAHAAAVVGGRVVVWDTTTGTQVGRVGLAAHAIALQGQRLALVTADGAAYAGSLSRVRAVAGVTGATAIALDPAHGDRVAVGGREGGVQVVETTHGGVLGAWSVHSGAVSALTFSRDGQYLATAAARGTGGAGAVVVLSAERREDEDPWAVPLGSAPERLQFDGDTLLATNPMGVTALTRGGTLLDMSAPTDAAGVSGGRVRWADPEGAIREVALPSTPIPTVPRGTPLAVSDDGRWSVSVDVDRLTVWEDRTGRLVRELPATGGPVVHALFDASGDHLAVLFSDRSVEVFEVATGLPIRNVDGPPEGTWLRFSDDASILWVRSGPREITGWDLATGDVRERVVVPGEAPLSVDPALRGRFVRLTDGVADAWLDTATSSPRRLYTAADGVRPLAVDAAGKRVAVVAGDGVERRRADDLHAIGGPLRSAGDAPGLSGAWSPDGRWLAAGYRSGLIRVWEVETGRVVASLGADQRLIGRGAARPLASITFDETGRYVTGRDATGFPRTWEWELSAEGGQYGLGAGPVLPEHTITSLAVSPDGRTLYSAHGDANLRAWNLADGVQSGFFWGHAAGITSVAVVGGGQRVVTASLDGTVRAWDVETAQEKAVGNAFGDPVRVMAVARSGARFAGFGDGGVLRTWDAGGQGLSRWATNAEVTRLDLGTDGGVLRATTVTGDTWLLDPEKGSVSHADPVPPAPIAPAAAGSGAGEPAPPDSPPAADPVAIARGYAERLSAVTAEVVTPDGATLVTAGADGRIRLWDLASRSLRGTLLGMTDGSWVVDRPDGTRYASESLRDRSSPLLHNEMLQDELGL